MSRSELKVVQLVGAALGHMLGSIGQEEQLVQLVRGSIGQEERGPIARDGHRTRRTACGVSIGQEEHSMWWSIEQGSVCWSSVWWVHRARRTACAGSVGQEGQRVAGPPIRKNSVCWAPPNKRNHVLGPINQEAACVGFHQARRTACAGVHRTRRTACVGVGTKPFVAPTMYEMISPKLRVARVSAARRHVIRRRCGVAKVWSRRGVCDVCRGTPGGVQCGDRVATEARSIVCSFCGDTRAEMCVQVPAEMLELLRLRW